MNGHVFVTRIIPAAGLSLVRAHCAQAGIPLDVWGERLSPPQPELFARAKGALGVLTTVSDRIDAAFMNAAGPQLRVISQMAVGVDNIETAAARARSIAVGNTPGVLTDTTADLAFALLLASARRLYESTRYITKGEWLTWAPDVLLGADLKGAVLGIVGYGRIGQAMARRAAAFSMRILAHSPSLTPGVDIEGAEATSLDRLLHDSDFISLHCPLNANTRHLINAAALAKMKPTARLINTARGPIVDTVALYEALLTGQIAAAALDVTDPEPLPADHPLLKLPNAIVVPHIGSATVGTRDLMAQMATENLIAGLNGDPLPNAVP